MEVIPSHAADAFHGSYRHRPADVEARADAMRDRPDRETAAALDECDARRCRLLLGVARRELERLRRPPLEPVDTFERGADRPPDLLAAPPQERKAYAPDPLGKPTPPGETPPQAAEVLEAVNHFHVTNLGTLLDVLA